MKDKTDPGHRNHGDDRAGPAAVRRRATAAARWRNEGQAIYAEIGRTLDIVDMTGGATDAGFANRSGKAVVVESFGLAGFGYHARDEYIDTGSIVPRLYLMTRMLMELGKEVDMAWRCPGMRTGKAPDSFRARVSAGP